ncbi:MAG: hypothetical protein VX265_07135 [Myxococcota bacterium]|nr:hypothetical protein [Myxococcota bacterium]
MTPLLLLSTLGCVALDETVASDLVLWSGTVLEDPYLGDEATALAGGGLVAVDLDDSEVAIGEESESTPGSYSLEVPAGAALAIRVTGPLHVPTVFRGYAPETRALWFNGALFGRQRAPLDAFLSGLGVTPDAGPGSLEDAERVHLWVEPADPTAMAGGTIDLTDGEGQPGAVLALTTTPDGRLVEATPADPVTLILGLDLAPGDVTLSLGAIDGRIAATTWPSRGGDLLVGPGFALVPE